jgi:hypothetical protein
MLGSPDRKVPPAGDQPAGEKRRRHGRTAVGWHARILIGQESAGECAVLNVSSRGAKLRLRLPVDLPGGFVLSIARFGDLQCEVLEQQQAVVRVGFIDPPGKIREFFRHQLPKLAEDGEPQ